MNVQHIPTPAPPDPRDARRVVLADANEGMRRLVSDVFRQWANQHAQLAARKGLDESNIAHACAIPTDTVVQLLRGQQPITETDSSFLSLRGGFRRLAAAHGFEYTSPHLSDELSFEVAGWLQALNKAGLRQGVPVQLRPIGVLHFYCLRLIFRSEHWHRDIIKGLPRPVCDQLAAQTFMTAEDLRSQVRDVLEDYTARSYALEGTYDAMRRLLRYWGNPWRSVYNWLRD